MSSSQFSAEAITNLQDKLTANEYFAAVAVLLLYDYALTIDQEIRLVWNSTLTFTTTLFYMSRIAMLGTAIAAVVNIPSYKSAASCNMASILWTTFTLLSSLTWAGGEPSHDNMDFRNSHPCPYAQTFSTLRVYVLSNRSWTLAAVALVTGLVPFCANLANRTSMSASVMTLASVTVCGFDVSMSLSAWEGGLIATRVSAIVSDIIVIAVTWHRSYVMRASRLSYPARTLLKLLFRDGSLYFIVLLVLNIAQITAVYLSGEDADEAAYVMNALNSIFVSRFLLSLRKVQVSVGDSFSDTSDPSDSVDDIQQSVSQLSTLVSFSTSMPLGTRCSAITSLNMTGRDELSINGDENSVVDPNLRDLETTELCRATLASHA